MGIYLADMNSTRLTDAFTGTKEDDGWIVSINYDAERQTSECVLLTASDLKLLACLNLRHVLPHGLHGAWDASCTMP